MDGLVGGIIHLLDLNTDFDTSKLRPPALRVTLGTRHRWRVNAFSVRTKNGNEVVLGVGLCIFLHQYTRAAATYFLPSVEGGERPSDLWPAARAAIATTLEWLSSPSNSPRYLDFTLTPHQARVAQILGDYAFRFALCHEMAHSLAEDRPFDAGAGRPTPQGDQDAVLAWSRDQEIMADRRGLEIQMAALADPSQVINGLASASYSMHAAELLRLRLMLVAELVDFTRWETRLTHPPLLFRTAMLFKVAERFVGGGAAGLQDLHNQLATLNNEIIGEVGNVGDQIAADTREEVERDLDLKLEYLKDNDLATEAVTSRLNLRPTDPMPPIALRVLELFERSPLGVMRGLDPLKTARTEERRQRAVLRAAIVARILEELPPEFARFMSLSLTERTDAILRIPRTSREI